MGHFAEIAPHLTNPLVLIGFVLMLGFGIHRTLIKSGILQPVSSRQSGVLVKILLRYGFIIALVLVVAGFGFAAWQAYLSAGQKVDVNAIVKTLTQKHAVDLAAAGEREVEARTQVRALTEAVTALIRQGAEQGAPPGVKDALLQLAKGETQAAEKIFREALARKEAEGQAARREAAAAARHLGALAELKDTKRALEAYRKATTLDPENIGGWVGLGDSAVSAGRLAEAARAFRQYLLLSKKVGDPREVSVAHDRIGDVQVALGNLSAALKNYRASLAIAERLAAADGNNASWQRDLSVSHNKIGDVQVAQGSLSAALDSYRASLAIAQRLAGGRWNNAGWQRDLLVSHNKIGDVLRAQGNLSDALAAHEKSLLIVQSLADRFPDHPQFQSDVAFTRRRLDELKRVIK